MTATPIPTHVICTVFQYIFPPSLPLPPHLLSRSLIERHHFLGISPSDVASYLLWPSSHTAQVAEALEEPCPETLIEHDVRYSAPDRETLLAHVRPHSLSPLQIVFAWDVEAAGWKYHDARMLPFPEGSQRALDDVLNPRTKGAGISKAPTDSNEISRDDDSYWAMYNSTSSPTTPVSATDAAEDEKTEEAYWASYNTIQGSGDSVIPSPAQPKTHLPSCKREDDLRHSDILIDPLITHLHLRLNEHDGLLSPLQSSTYVDYKDEAQQPDSHRLKHVEPENTNIDKGQETCGGGSSEADEGVKDAIRGIYRLWKSRAPSADMGSFLDVVRSALET